MEKGTNEEQPLVVQMADTSDKKINDLADHKIKQAKTSTGFSGF